MSIYVLFFLFLPLFISIRISSSVIFLLCLESFCTFQVNCWTFLLGFYYFNEEEKKYAGFLLSLIENHTDDTKIGPFWPRKIIYIITYKNKHSNCVCVYTVQQFKIDKFNWINCVRDNEQCSSVFLLTHFDLSVNASERMH